MQMSFIQLITFIQSYGNLFSGSSSKLSFKSCNSREFIISMIQGSFENCLAVFSLEIQKIFQRYFQKCLLRFLQVLLHQGFYQQRITWGYSRTFFWKFFQKILARDFYGCSCSGFSNGSSIYSSFFLKILSTIPAKINTETIPQHFQKKKSIHICKSFSSSSRSYRGWPK